jgi:hypothetical protein
LLSLLPFLLEGQQARCLSQPGDHPDGHERYAAFRQLINHYQASHPVINRSVIMMPVVIHVVARDPVQPVSLAQALQQIDVLNADFAGAGENTNRLSDEFLALSSDVMIRFCLATMDPEGQPTDGITFTQTEIQDIALETRQGGRKAIHWDQLGGKTGWDPARYINIWIGEYGSLLGSASFPGMAAYPEEIGIVVDPKYFGVIGDAGQSGFYSRGHTLSHEMGHFLGLKHIWGDDLDYSCEDTDDIDDTPNAEGPYYDCPSGTQMSCGTSNMYQNFMDFTDDRCLAAFTHGQAEVMRAARALFYPEVIIHGECSPVAESFDVWTQQIYWSHDVPSDTYIAFSDQVWPDDVLVNVFSVDGRMIHEGTWSNQLSYTFELDQVASGIYVAVLRDGSKKYVRKLIVY